MNVSAPALEQSKPLKEVCTFGIGGPASYYIEVRTIDELKVALEYSQNLNIPFFVLGKGSNCLFDDRGYAGLIIHNKIDFKNELSPGVFHVGAGYSFSLLGAQTARAGWSGLEFASGIPGSVGGAIFMNAGANGKETCETLISVEFLTPERILKVYSAQEMTFSYRTSSFQKMQGCIVGATFALSQLPEARSKQLEIINYRKHTQPYGDKSAGCIFRNPLPAHAGALIDKGGLKGSQVGGAKVSEMHANFIVNTAQAKASDVLNLIEFIKKRVKEQTGVELESEVRYIPYETKNDE